MADLPPPVLCYRCGRPGHCDWVDVTSYGDVEPPQWMPGEQYCLTPGCADLDGSRRLQPLTAQQMRDRELQSWFEHHRSLTVEGR